MWGWWLCRARWGEMESSVTFPSYLLPDPIRSQSVPGPVVVTAGSASRVGSRARGWGVALKGKLSSLTPQIPCPHKDSHWCHLGIFMLVTL